MNQSSKSYKVFKTQKKELLNFITTVFYSIVSLRKNIKELDSSAIIVSPRPEFFQHDKTKPNSLYRLTYGYKLKMGAYGLLSLFSFFEAYVNDVLFEIFTFQGGYEEFITTSNRKAKKSMNNTSSEISGYKQKLQRNYEPKRISDFRVYGLKLSDNKYVFPSQLFSSYGIQKFSQEIKRLRAKDIPKILQEALHMELSESTCTEFMKIKDIRNNIAHGRKSEYSITEVMDFHTFIAELAKEIDNHIMDNFFLFEKYS